MTAEVASVAEGLVAGLATAEEGSEGRPCKADLDLDYQVVGYQDHLEMADNPADRLPIESKVLACLSYSCSS